MTLRLNGSTSGYTAVDAPATAGNNTLVLPTGNGTADQVISTDGSGTLSFVNRSRMVLETAKTATSTAVDFTGIPSWVKKITVMFNEVSTSGTANHQIQIGSGSFTVTGYNAQGSVVTGGSATAASTTGFILGTSYVAALSASGQAVITNVTGNTWVSSGNMTRQGSGVTAGVAVSAGSITLAGVLDRVRITTTGTDTFDAGSINILYEG